MAKSSSKKSKTSNTPLSVPHTEQPAPVPHPATTSASRVAPSSAKSNKNTPAFLFDSTNYKWMIGGVLLIILGFILMSGGKSDNPNEFHYDQIYSFRRVTLAPLVVLLGFAVEFYAIMRKPSN